MMKQVPKQCFTLNQDRQDHYLASEKIFKIKRIFPLICLNQNHAYF